MAGLVVEQVLEISNEFINGFKAVMSYSGIDIKE